MKKMLKKMMMVISVTGAVILLGACGSGGGKDSDKKETKETETSVVSSEVYLSNQNMEFMSAYPQYTFKQASFGFQTLRLVNGTQYELTSFVDNYSGALQFGDDGESSADKRGTNVIIYTGKYTSSDQDGLLTVELEKPENIAANSSYNAGDAPMGYVNTAEWTDEMGAAAGGKDGAISVEDYLAKYAFESQTVIVDGNNASFEYLQILPKPAAE